MNRLTYGVVAVLALLAAIAVVIVVPGHPARHDIAIGPPPTAAPTHRPIPRPAVPTRESSAAAYVPVDPGGLGYAPQAPTVVPPLDIPPAPYTPPAQVPPPAPVPNASPAPGSTSRNAFLIGIPILSTVTAFYNVDDNGLRFRVDGTAQGMTAGLTYSSALHSDAFCAGPVVASAGAWAGNGTARTLTATFPGLSVDRVASIDITTAGAVVNCAQVRR